MDWSSINQAIIEEFRANNGRVAQFGGLPMVILHTIGARSGDTIEVPLVLIEEDGQHLIFASAAGSKKHPGWYYNLIANPLINVEYASGIVAASVELLTADAAQSQRDTQQARSEQFASYITSASPRVIPVFAIHARDD